jgi:phosphonate transport system ATP-binding protein
MVALIGASGSGKSTLLRHIAGLTRADVSPQGSQISVNGRTVQ